MSCGSKLSMRAGFSKNVARIGLHGIGALTACLLPAIVIAAAETPAKRHNEITLARLRPGRDRLAAAISLYGRNYRRVVSDSDDVLAWVDSRRRHVLRIELGEGGKIVSVTVSAIDPLLEDAGGPKTSLPSKALAAGRGLSLGEPRDRVQKLYGPAASSGPSTQQGYELELMFYSFDWAGSEVPQVMEVTSERSTGRVVQITLAFPSL